MFLFHSTQHLALISHYLLALLGDLYAIGTSLIFVLSDLTLRLVYCLSRTIFLCDIVDLFYEAIEEAERVLCTCLISFVLIEPVLFTLIFMFFNFDIGFNLFNFLLGFWPDENKLAVRVHLL